jgi:hypothetical protein
MSVSFFVKGSEQEINMCNRNAMMVLQVLGYSADDYCNEIHPDGLPNFINRCNAALGSINQFPGLDAEIDTAEFHGENGCHVISFGVPDGYLTERIAELKLLACVAYEAQQSLVWC